MARQVFFSFHYDDVLAVNVVRHSDTFRSRYKPSSRAFFDKSLWEETKKQGDLAIKRMINRGLEGSSVTCVLIGQETWERPWVRYELSRSFERGNGIFGVHIHQTGPDNAQLNSLASLLATPPTDPMVAAVFPQSAQPKGWWDASIGELLASVFTEPPPTPGPNPLSYLSVYINSYRRVASLHQWDVPFWWSLSEFAAIPVDRVPYRLAKSDDYIEFADLFPVYDWKADNGKDNFGDWIEQAARDAGR